MLDEAAADPRDRPAVARGHTRPERAELRARASAPPPRARRLRAPAGSGASDGGDRPRAVVVGVLVLAGDRVLELAQARAERVAQAGQSLGAEDQQHDDEDDDELERGRCEGMACPPRGQVPTAVRARARSKPPRVKFCDPRRYRGQGADEPPPITATYVRRVVLPSGKTIEVVYFERDPTARRRPGSAGRSTTSTSAPSAPRTSSTRPSGKRPATHWEVTAPLPQLRVGRDGIFDQDVVERFDEDLDRGTEVLVRDLKRLTHANMEDEIERFMRALRDDHPSPPRTS